VFGEIGGALDAEDIFGGGVYGDDGSFVAALRQVDHYFVADFAFFA
jgi:hypothetical protein